MNLRFLFAFLLACNILGCTRTQVVVIEYHIHEGPAVSTCQGQQANPTANSGSAKSGGSIATGGTANGGSGGNSYSYTSQEHGQGQAATGNAGGTVNSSSSSHGGNSTATGGARGISNVNISNQNQGQSQTQYEVKATTLPTTLPAMSLKDEAVKWLQIARDLRGLNTESIKNIRAYSGKGNIILSEIGTSEEELSQLESKGYLAEVKKYLSKARANNDHTNYWNIELIKSYVSQGTCTLEDAGTSEIELIDLLNKGYMNQAKLSLESARVFGNPSYWVQDVRDNVAKAGCTLKDIGTSEEELNKLSKQ